MLLYKWSNLWKNAHTWSFTVYCTIKTDYKNYVLSVLLLLKHRVFLTRLRGIMTRLRGITITETKKQLLDWKNWPGKKTLKHTGFKTLPKCLTLFPFSDIFMQKKALTGDKIVASWAEIRKDRWMQWVATYEGDFELIF